MFTYLRKIHFVSDTRQCTKSSNTGEMHVWRQGMEMVAFAYHRIRPPQQMHSVRHDCLLKAASMAGAVGGAGAPALCGSAAGGALKAPLSRLDHNSAQGI